MHFLFEGELQSVVGRPGGFTGVGSGEQTVERS
jgi:hypothetical protein